MSEGDALSDIETCLLNPLILIYWCLFDLFIYLYWFSLFNNLTLYKLIILCLIDILNIFINFPKFTRKGTLFIFIYHYFGFFLTNIKISSYFINTRYL